MKYTLKAFFPEKKNYNDFIDLLSENKIEYEYKYEFPEYLITLDTQKGLLDKVYEDFGEYIFADEDITLIDIFHDTISKTDITISGAESCTGGLVSKYLTDRAGSSKYFKYSVVSYSNESKIKILNINKEKMEKKGVVSKATIIGMLEGLEYIYPTNIAYAVTGIAGPTGGTKEQPIGTVFIGIVQYGRREIQAYQFEGSRWEIRRYSTWTILLKMLNKIKNDL